MGYLADDRTLAVVCNPAPSRASRSDKCAQSKRTFYGTRLLSCTFRATSEWKCSLDFGPQDSSFSGDTHVERRISNQGNGDAVGALARGVFREGAARPRFSCNCGTCER